MRGISKASCLPTLNVLTKTWFLSEMFLYLKVEYAAIKICNSPIPTFHREFPIIKYFTPHSFKQETIGVWTFGHKQKAHQPVQHVKIKIVGEVLGDPLSLRFFEPSKPETLNLISFFLPNNQV